MMIYPIFTARIPGCDPRSIPKYGMVIASLLGWSCSGITWLDERKDKRLCADCLPPHIKISETKPLIFNPSSWQEKEPSFSQWMVFPAIFSLLGELCQQDGLYIDSKRFQAGRVPPKNITFEFRASVFIDRI
jgi:hypothetical protein